MEILQRKCFSIKIQAETAFDQIVGAIEDIVIDDRFQDLQTDLLEKHFHHFDVSTSTLTKRQKQKDKKTNRQKIFKLNCWRCILR